MIHTHYCETCNKKFTTKYKKSKYCSRSCYGAWRKTLTGDKNILWRGGKVKCVCLFCEQIFYTIPAKIKAGKGIFCSVDCYHKYHNADSIYKCKVCGKEFHIKNCAIKKGNGKFCSRRCYHAWHTGENVHSWQGGTSFLPYCYKFNERRKRACRDFFGGYCLVTGEHQNDCLRKHSVHHIDHDKEQGCNGNPFNLVPMNTSHHLREQYNKEEYATYINKTLREGFKWGIWNEQEYIEKVMYDE